MLRQQVSNESRSDVAPEVLCFPAWAGFPARKLYSRTLESSHLRCVQKKGASEASVHPGLAKVEDRSWPSLTIELGWTPLAKIDMFVLFVPTAATLGYIRWHSLTPVLGALAGSPWWTAKSLASLHWDPCQLGQILGTRLLEKAGWTV